MLFFYCLEFRSIRAIAGQRVVHLSSPVYKGFMLVSNCGLLS